MNISLSGESIAFLEILVMAVGIPSLFMMLFIAPKNRKRFLWFFMVCISICSFIFLEVQKSKIRENTVWNVDTPILLYTDDGEEKVVSRRQLPESQTGKYFFRHGKWIPIPPE